MPDHKPFLPPHIGKWLASKKSSLREKAEAALRAAEPDADDLLYEQIGKERQNFLTLWVITIAAFQTPVFVATHSHGDQILTVSRIAGGLLVAFPLVFLCAQFLLLPAVRRLHAVTLALARRGDARSVPYLFQQWQPSIFKATEPQIDVETALCGFMQNAAPGTVWLSMEPKSKDPAAQLRLRFGALTKKRKGSGNVYGFAPKATVTRQRIELWLALLPHLALDADANLKSRAVLHRIADADAQTLDEELIKNAAHYLLYGNTRQPSQTTDASASAWTPAESDLPAQSQRLGRR